MRPSTNTLITVLVAVLIIAATSARGFLVDSNDALRAAAAQGFSNAQIVSESRIFPGFSGCDSGDAAGFHMTATNPKGEQINFTVCSGWPFKGATIRY